MFLGMTYFQIFSYFVIYSFIGWCVEVIYHAVRFGRVINRGFLNGPVCPVYGFGVILVFGVLNLVSQNFSSTGGMQSIPIPILYVLGMILTTFVEFMGGFLLDKFFHARWWDYRNEKFNFCGYICLKFSLIWGAGIVLIVRFLHPALIEHQLAIVPEKYGWWILLIMYAAYVSDVIVSALTMMKLNQKLAELEELRRSMRVVSNTLSYALAAGTFVTDDIVRKNHQYEEAKGADAANTLETREEFDEKYEAMQANMTERREAATARAAAAKEAVVNQMNTAKEAAADQMSTAKEAVAESMSAVRETLTEKVAAATDALSEKVGEVAEAARDNVADYQLKAAENKELRKAEAEYRREQAEKARAEWVENFRKGRNWLLKRLFRNQPDIQHTEYQEAMDELRAILEEDNNKKAG